MTSATYTYAGTGSTTYASSTTAPTAVGTYSITPSAATLNFTTGSAANYSTPDTYVAGMLTISLAGNVTLLFGTAPTGTTYGQDPQVTATPNPSTGTTVVYSSATPLVCSVNASTGVVTTLAQGTCTIDANDSGNGSYGPASQVAQSFNVATATAPTVTAANKSITVGGSFTASAMVSGLQNSDAASVTSATYTYAGTGSTTYASSTTAPTAVGTYSITPSAATLNFTTGSAANYSTPDTYVAGTLTISLAGNVTLLFGTAPTGTTYGQDPRSPRRRTPLRARRSSTPRRRRWCVRSTPPRAW